MQVASIGFSWVASFMKHGGVLKMSNVCTMDDASIFSQVLAAGRWHPLQDPNLLFSHDKTHDQRRWPFLIIIIIIIIIVVIIIIIIIIPQIWHGSPENHRERKGKQRNQSSIHHSFTVSTFLFLFVECWLLRTNLLFLNTKMPPLWHHK